MHTVKHEQWTMNNYSLCPVLKKVDTIITITFFFFLLLFFLFYNPH